MAKLIDYVFGRSDWYVTSPYGWRNHPVTGKRTFHYGTDYGTDLQKWPQYAVEEGYVLLVGTSGGYGNHLWVRYPRIGKALFHAHLSSIAVKKGDKVKKGTLLGYTGTTGNSTGIHLHLGMQPIGKSNWENVHTYNYKPPAPAVKPQPPALPQAVAPTHEPAPAPSPAPEIPAPDTEPHRYKVEYTAPAAGMYRIYLEKGERLLVE